MPNLFLLCPTCFEHTPHFRGTETVEDKRQDGNGYHYWVRVTCKRCEKRRWYDFARRMEDDVQGPV